jgi:hypothetical protein
MSDRFDVLERFAPLFEAPEPSFDGFLRRRDRKRRTQRVAAGVVGIAVFLAAVWLVTSGGPLDRTQTRPGGQGPSETGPGVTGPEVRTDFQGVGLIGLPPEGATPSTPLRGELILRFMFLQGTGDAGRFGGAVYQDGRLIWWRLGPPENPEGTGQRSHLERHLTPEDVELLKAELSSSGLFDRDRHLFSAQGLHAGEIEVPNGDGLARVTWGDCCSGDQAEAGVSPTAEQASALRRLEARLNALAWEEGDVEAYVASMYTLCLKTEQDGGTDRLISALPPQAEDLVRSWDLSYRTQEDPGFPYYSSCSTVTTERARVLARALEEAGISQIAFGDEVEYDVHPRSPDRTDVLVALYVLLPHEV